ncbi:AraC family transcriptional regulator ligand-binding domain-containing protein [Tateyamaria sp.]|uniref:AraC family transcriptional regulator ligand-binding domain-containing protein n=1 Tax=Tateyamaria sp. TaxID=1929288 RepID=UPI0039B850BB
MLMKDSLPATLSVAFLHPFLEEMLRRGTKKSRLAARIGLEEASLFDPSVLVPANNVYAFLKWIAAETKEPLLCARIGQQMAMGMWAPLLPLMASAKTIGDFFQKFSLMASEQGCAVSYKLVVEGPVAVWRLDRAKGASEDAVLRMLSLPVTFWSCLGARRTRNGTLQRSSLYCPKRHLFHEICCHRHLCCLANTA